MQDQEAQDLHDLYLAFGKAGVRWLARLTRAEAQLVMARAKETVAFRRRARRTQPADSAEETKIH